VSRVEQSSLTRPAFLRSCVLAFAVPVKQAAAQLCAESLFNLLARSALGVVCLPVDQA
jgi:hypothetical protein